MLLYGVCRDFWKLVLRKPSDVLDYGNSVRIDTNARKDMTRLFKSMKVTSSLSSAPKDVTKCVFHGLLFATMCHKGCWCTSCQGSHHA
jgi:hypothetical protein